MCTCASFANVYLAPLVAALFVLLVLSGNVFAARRKPSECKPNLHPLETHQLYSRLISCTRKISTLHLEFKCVHPIHGVYTPFMGNPRVYPLCDPAPALSESLTSTFLSQNSGISHLTRNEVSRQLSDHRDVSP